MYHTAVLLHEAVEALVTDPQGVYVDATFGGGGHSEAIVKRLTDNGRLYSFDQDEAAAANAQRAPFVGNRQFTLIASNFRHLQRQLRAYEVMPGTVQGILADLGVSSYQLDTAERGFSYRFEADLDMRMSQHSTLTAATVLNTYSAEALHRVFGELGEVRNAKTLAQACVAQRAKSPFVSTTDLTTLCENLRIGDRWRYLSQVYQALRMEVNDELGALRELLPQCLQMLAPGGRLAVITFHSIEDRMVKNFLKTGNVEGHVQQDFYGNIKRPFKMITKKPMTASAQEEKENPRARSAHLRVGMRHDE